MMEDYSCLIPLLILLLVAVVLNVIMTRHIYKTEDTSSVAGFMFKFVAISNVACGIFISFRAVVKVTSVSLHLLWLTSAAVIISVCLQLGANVSLAFERLQVVKNAMKYRTIEAKKGLQRKLSLAVCMFSLIVAVSCTTLRFYFKNAVFIALPLAASRITGYVALCILYYKLLFAMKRQNKAIAPSVQKAGQSSNSNNDGFAGRRKQMEHARKFFIGITSSFFVLNLPSIVICFTNEEFPYCKTVTGSLSVMSSGFSNANMIFDVIWYFYMHRRSRRKSRK